MSTNTDTRALTRAWAIIVTLSLISVGANLARTHLAGLGFWAGALAMVLAFIKARQVLDHFLGLRRTAGPWRGLFTALLVLICAGVVALAGLERLGLP